MYVKGGKLRWSSKNEVVINQRGMDKRWWKEYIKECTMYKGWVWVEFLTNEK